jgi:hypothetical protein
MDKDSNMTDELFGENNGRPAGKKNKPQEPIKFEKQVDSLSSFVGLLTEAEKAEIRQQAKDQVLKEQKDREKAALLAQFIKEEKQIVDPKEMVYPIVLHLAPHANCIMLDGKQYFTEQVYDVTIPVGHVLIEQMNRGWAHEAATQVTDSKGRRPFQPPMGIGFGNFMDNRRPRNLAVGSENVGAHIAEMHRTLHG